MTQTLNGGKTHQGQIDEYLRFKKELLLELCSTDGLGLLESGIFEKYQANVWGKVISSCQGQHSYQKQIQIQQQSKSRSNNVCIQNRCRPQISSEYNVKQGFTTFILPKNKNKSNQSLGVGQGIQMQDGQENRPLQLTNKHSINQNYQCSQSIYQMMLRECELEEEFLSAQLDQSQAQDQSKLFEMLQQHLRGRNSNSSQNFKINNKQLIVKMFQFVKNIDNKYKESLRQQEEEIQNLRVLLNSQSPQTTRRSEKEMGKRELALLVNEKSLNEKREELLALEAQLRERQEKLNKDSQSYTRQRERKSWMTHESSVVETGAESRASCPNPLDLKTEKGFGRERMELLNEKVRFEGFKKDTLFEMGKENALLESNILPRLKSLHKRMNFYNYE